MDLIWYLGLLVNFVYLNLQQDHSLGFSLSRWHEITSFRAASQ